MLEIDGNHFRLTTPALVKSLAGPDGMRRAIEGVAADGKSRDEHNEIVLPSALELDYFGKQGRINWDHGRRPHDIIGEPVKWKLNSRQWYVWALLYIGVDFADAAWKLFDAGAHLAWSVEGRTLARDPADRYIITRARVYNLALTHNPVLADTYARKSDPDVAQSLEQASEDVLHKGLTTESGAPLTRESLEGTDRDVLEAHLAIARGDRVCSHLGPDGGFLDDYNGAIAHFYNCCGGSVDQAARMAERHGDLARITGRHLIGGK